MYELLNQILEWLQASACDEARRIVQNAIRDFIHWPDIVQQVRERGVEAGIAALTAVKDEVLRFCREYPNLVERLARFGVTTAARWGIETVVKTGVKRGTTLAAKKGIGFAAKNVVKGANPVGIVADLTQAGLEYAGNL